MGDSYEEALLNSMIATGYKIPLKTKGIMISSGDAKDKVALLARQEGLEGHAISILSRFDE